MSDPRYPIGPFAVRESLTPDERAAELVHIAATPEKMRAAVAGLTDSQLDTPYRDGGWTLRQVVHHVPDSHLNAYCRLKIALTEPGTPTIRPYDESTWAKLADSRDTPIDVSLTLLESVHARWMKIWASMTDDDFARTFLHPDSGKHTVDWLLALYSWHGRHHVGHITSTRERMGW